MPENVLAYFIRHGTTSLNESHAFRGPLNPPLDGKGASDAVQLKKYFENIDLGDAYTSDKLRAETTAQTILEPKGIEPIATNLLNSWNVGFLAGKPKEGNEETIKYYQDNPDQKIPHGESLNQFRARIRPVIQNIVKRGHEVGLPSIAVVHSSVIHEVGNIFHGNHNAALVKPGGVVAVVHGDKGIRAIPIIKADSGKAGYGS